MIGRGFPGILLLPLLLGCPKRPEPPPPPPDVEPEVVLDLARERVVPDPLRSRLTVRVASPVLEVAGSTGGGIVVDRPGRLRLDVFGPLGATLFTVVSDGLAFDVVSWRESQHFASERAELALRELTGGVAGLDDLLAVLVGDLPFPEVEAAALLRLDDGAAMVTLEGPEGIVVEAVLDPLRGTPSSFAARDGHGALVLSAEYGDYAPIAGEGTPLVPDRILLYVPELQLTLELRYRGWSTPDEEPGVFTVAVPADFESIPLEEAIRQLRAQLDGRPSP